MIVPLSLPETDIPSSGPGIGQSISSLPLPQNQSALINSQNSTSSTPTY